MKTADVHLIISHVRWRLKQADSSLVSFIRHTWNGFPQSRCLLSCMSQSVSAYWKQELLPVLQRGNISLLPIYGLSEVLHTHTHTRPSLCISWPLQWVMTGVDCIRVQHRAANTHNCGWWSERTHRKKNHFWCDELGLIQCPRRWKGSDLLVSVKRPTLQFNSMATYLLALIQPF